MNNKRYFPAFLVLFLFLCPLVNAQNKNGWEPMYLQVSGSNNMDGVEASFQASSCNNENVVYLKFVNKNDYAVKLEWFDAVFTQELKWVNKEGEANKRTLVLPAKGQMTGSCVKTPAPELIVKLNDFVSDRKNFKRYVSSQLTITATH